jgi:hypothetical protein
LLKTKERINETPIVVVLLDAAKYDNQTCFEFFEKGKLTYAAEEFIIKPFYGMPE